MRQSRLPRLIRYPASANTANTPSPLRFPSSNPLPHPTIALTSELDPSQPQLDPYAIDVINLHLSQTPPLPTGPRLLGSLRTSPHVDFNWSGTRSPRVQLEHVVLAAHSYQAGVPPEHVAATLDALARLGATAIRLKGAMVMNRKGRPVSLMAPALRSGVSDVEGLKSFVRAAHMRGIEVYVEVLSGGGGLWGRGGDL